MEHTPTPWATFGWKNGFTCGIQGTKPMHRVTSDNVFRVDDDLDMANAAFIVRAVNCHDELVEALKRSVDIIKNYKSTYEPFEDDEGFFNDVEKALAKADGKQ